MTKLIDVGFTNYFGPTEEIKILDFDNNKYVNVLRPDGGTYEIKAGYIYSNRELTRRIPPVDWFIHGGGKRLDYRPTVRDVFYLVWIGASSKRFTTKKSAVEYGHRMALKLKETVEITKVTSVLNSRGYSSRSMNALDCYPNGLVRQYTFKQSRKADSPCGKFLRGYGKMFHKRY
jgi:hypothetical protein